jgi:hypothetical protein
MAGSVQSALTRTGVNYVDVNIFKSLSESLSLTYAQLCEVGVVLALHSLHNIPFSFAVAA